MKTLLQKFVTSLAFMALLLGSTAVHAQNGNGAYVRRNIGSQCMGNILLGVAALPVEGCVTMSQTVFMELPSGRARSIWVGTLTPEQTPAVKTVYKYNWTEPFNGVVYYYESVAVAMPDGSLKLTLNGDNNL